MAIERLRLFFALWADDEVRRRVARLTRPWRSIHPYRWTAPDKLHLTLAFLGDIKPERVAELYRIGQSLPVPAFELTLDKLEFWSRPEVLCLTASAVPEPLQTLVGQLNAALDDARFPTEKRPYRPHLTLARRAWQLPTLDAKFSGLAWKAQQCCLVESKPREMGSPYGILRTLPMGESAHGA